MSVFDNHLPNIEVFKSGSGNALLHSAGGLVYDITVACGSAKGLVRMFDSVSVSAGTMRVFARTQINTQGNPTFMLEYRPPMPFNKKIRLKRNGGGVGGGASAGIANNRMVVKVRFFKEVRRTSVS